MSTRPANWKLKKKPTETPCVAMMWFCTITCMVLLPWNKFPHDSCDQPFEHVTNVFHRHALLPDLLSKQWCWHVRPCEPPEERLGIKRTDEIVHSLSKWKIGKNKNRWNRHKPTLCSRACCWETDSLIVRPELLLAPPPVHIHSVRCKTLPHFNLPTQDTVVHGTSKVHYVSGKSST